MTAAKPAANAPHFGELSDLRGPDELRLTVAGQHLSGWQQVRVTRGVERVPSDFDLLVTERYPGEARNVLIHPGDTCTVSAGPDLLLTGYVDRYLSGIDAESHTVRVMGRSACEDLVDCSVIWDGYQLSATSLRDAAKQLAGKYGIAVRALDGDGPAIPQVNIQLGETPFELIERLARWSAMLVYDDPSGNLVLARVGHESMASGARESVNVQRAQTTLTMDERFSEYYAYWFSINSCNDLGTLDGNAQAVVKDEGLAKLKRTDGQPRVRRRAVISEQPYGAENFAELRAKWEMARRMGRSQAVAVTVDSWRDARGKLWEPNTLAPVHIPSCKVRDQNWIIAEVSYLRSERGTEAALTLMPPDAFSPEPTILQPFYADLQRDLHSGPRSTEGDAALGTTGRRDRG